MKTNRFGQLGGPFAIVGIVAMMVIPLPASVLDLLLVLNLAAGVMILLATMFVQKALDFSVFPSLLLVATLFRLALNVSSVRLVLLHGYAGQVIESFGHVVIGGSVVVGLVIFLILVVIQFIVITNGAGRVAEVGARFTLDAMPGKQMAIDADLNSGMITEDVARRRRREVAAEADFYGAMDGASKFVKGDAIAGIVITAINLVGGFLVGVVQKGMPIGEAIDTYSLLTIGDGLTAQIPALLISVSSGLIVTRAAGEADMGTDLITQFGRQTKALRVGAVCIATMGLVPGLPKIPFLVMGGGLWIAAGRAEATQARLALETGGGEGGDGGPDGDAPSPDAPASIVADIRLDPLELEIGFGLMDLVDPGRGGDLLDRVKALRRKIARDLGLVIPPVRTRDNLDLGAHSYVIRVHGVEAARGEAPSGRVLLLGDRPPGIPGEDGIDPVFGMQASWIPQEHSHQAELHGATIVDRPSVLTAHLAEVVRQQAARLLSRQDVKLLVDSVKASDPVVVDELTAAGLTLSEVQVVLQNLLGEQVPVRDLVRILEVLSERARTTKDPEALTEATRLSLGPAIAAAWAVGGRLPALTLDPVLEHGLLEALRPGEGGSHLALDADVADALLASVAATIHDVEDRGDAPVLLCTGHIRPALRRLLRGTQPALPVLAYGELGGALTIDTVGVIDLVQPATRGV
jgi:flagellar biosynthesis protein FlhA